MTRSATLFLTAFLLLIFAGCGGMNNSAMVMNNTRQLQMVTVMPSSADAQKFPGNQVQFTAAGTFTMAPMSGTVMVKWSIGDPFSAMPLPMSSMSTGQPTIDMNGLAQCNGFVGIAPIEATAPADPNMSLTQMTSMTKNVSGMASLVCP